MAGAVAVDDRSDVRVLGVVDWGIEEDAGVEETLPAAPALSHGLGGAGILEDDARPEDAGQPGPVFPETGQARVCEDRAKRLVRVLRLHEASLS